MSRMIRTFQWWIIFGNFEEKTDAVLDWFSRFTLGAATAILFWLIIPMVIITFLPSEACALDVEARYTVQKADTTNTISVDGSQELRIGHKMIIASFRKTNFSLYGIHSELYSYGLGLRKKVLDGISVYGMGTYNQPSYDCGILKHGQGPWEGPYYEANERAAPSHAPQYWDGGYKTTLDPSWGVRIGADFNYQIWRGLTVGFSIGYNFLTIDRTLTTYDAAGNKGWEWTIKENFGGPEAGALIGWRF